MPEWSLLPWTLIVSVSVGVLHPSVTCITSAYDVGPGNTEPVVVTAPEIKSIYNCYQTVLWTYTLA